MSKIDEKYHDLKNHGFDLGAALGAEEDAHSGGRVRRYERGHIYYHPNTGAHEVHGGILSLYLANGGPGPSPVTGLRELGYPTTDEVPGTPPRSLFETGEIFWTQGTGGCVISGAIWGRYRQGPGVGLPITSNIPVAGGQVAFFERGAIYAARAGGKTRVLTGFLSPPLMGRPELVDTGETAGPTGVTFRWALIMKEDHDALVAMRPNVYTEILQNRYSLTAVGKPSVQLPLVMGSAHVSGPFQKDVKIGLSLPRDLLAERTLYDLRCALPNGNHYALSPHCFYTRKAWDDFGLLHITDVHISKRNNDFRARLQQGGLNDAAQNYSNFQDNLRDFIRYANKLHSLGLADAVVATGDLVDYAKEDGDSGLNDNFARLRQLILGQPLAGGSPPGEELRLPVFATFGNHDYRVHPYDLRANIDVPGGDNDKALNEYSSHNLMESDAISLQAEHTPSYGLSDAEAALRMLWTDQSGNAYNYFDKYFTNERNYVVKLGKNRLVVLDTQMDEGVPGLVNSALLLQLLTDSANESTKRLLSGTGPNSYGFGDPQLDLLREAIHEAGNDGTVIVGMHAPAISPAGGEYPFYLRETVHPTAAPALTDGYIARNKLNGTTWPRTGTPYFKTGNTDDGLNVGIGWNRNREFLELCAGVGVPRPVDLILCGHVHRYVEHRFRHTGNGFEFYMDFYSENPKVYYPTNTLPALSGLPQNSKIAVQIVENAPLPPGVAIVRDHRGSAATETVPATESGRARVPPYPDPLDKSTDPRAWWQKHRPVHAQTSALGPIESRQRYGTFYKITNPPQKYRPVIESDRGFAAGAFEGLTPLPRPFISPTFQGFRLIQVKDNVIDKMRYIRLADLRKNDFKMPWEPKRFFDTVHVHLGGAILQ
ncbi:MAG: metallophosphoesterase [Rhizobium sp.]